eukprot:TRINITY_DN12003_c0_g1_i1.p1 TRINITY_DN12003_c0_g1~~TRINITY_DN12003_c0_g1_i1.p1  ORF type:complete len:711 (+),score=206.53 TRINITY_DN12003_c0_g1_i1:128-2260(+)
MQNKKQKPQRQTREQARRAQGDAAALREDAKPLPKKAMEKAGSLPQQVAVPRLRPKGARSGAERERERAQPAEVKRKSDAPETSQPVAKRQKRDTDPVLTTRQRVLQKVAQNKESQRWTDMNELKLKRSVRAPPSKGAPASPVKKQSESEKDAAAAPAETVEVPLCALQLAVPPTAKEAALAKRLVPMDFDPEAGLEGFAAHLKKCKNVVVCIGAGASVAAGIPDFRTPGKGLYSNQRLRDYNVPRPEDVFNLRYFKRRPDACYSMLGDMWPGNWPPTRVHYFLSLLRRKGMLGRVYTQNIDDLERLAGVPPELLVEAHGTFSRVKCVDCGFSPPVEFVKAALKEARRPLCPICTAGSTPYELPNPRRGIDIRVQPSAPPAKLFVYGGLRPDDTMGFEPSELFSYSGVDFMKASVKGVKLYHDARPVIRIPDPGATLEDSVQGYLLRFKDASVLHRILDDLDMREGCPVLSERVVVMAQPEDGGAPEACYAYHSPACAHHTEVPFGDWERRREWPALPELRGLIKPNIVFFDEELPDNFSPARIEADLASADALIIIGTSLRVTPFSWLPHLVNIDCPRLLLNLNAEEVAVRAGFNLEWHGWRDVAHNGDCQAGITALAHHLGWEDELVALKQEGDMRMKARWKADDDARSSGDDDEDRVASIDGKDWGMVYFDDGIETDEDDEEGEEDEEDEESEEDEDKLHDKQEAAV